MKKFIFFLLLSAFYNAQEFSKLDTIQFGKTVEQFILDTGKNFKLSEKQDKHNTPAMSTNIALIYNNDSKTDRFNVIYQTSYTGANAALEKKGTKIWNIRSLSGNFLSLFPIWKKYADVNSEIEATSLKKYQTVHNGKFDWTFIELGENIWKIEQSGHEPKQDFEYAEVHFLKSKTGFEFSKQISKKLENQIKEDFATDKTGNYTAFYDVFLLDGIPDKMKLKARLNR